MSFTFDGSAREFETFYAEKSKSLRLYAALFNESVQRKAMPDIIETFGQYNQPNLTEKEKEVLRFLAEGHTYNQIADKLVVGVSTIRKHTQSLIKKLNARNTTHACVVALHWGLLW